LRRIPEWSGRKDAALLFEGKLLLELRRGADAERAFLACVERENAGAPPAVSARLELFALYAMEERVEAFKRMFWSTFPMLGPEERLPALTMRMRIEFEQTKPELNAQLLRAYIQNDPADFQARAGLASALDHAGESTAARQQFDEAQRLAPNDVEIYVRLLDLASRQADQPAVGRLLEHRPPGSDNNAEVQKFVGQAALEKGDLSAAAAAFQRAAELRPDVPEHRHRLAQVLIRQGRREEAQVHATERNRLNQAREALRQAWNAFADAYESDPAHVSASLLDAVGRACIDARMEREGEAWLAEAGRLSSR
jgi:cytochrome c-type biogenesis protein CcmH/NrfG